MPCTVALMKKRHVNIQSQTGINFSFPKFEANSSLSRSLFCAYGSQIRRHNVLTGELVSVLDGHDDEVTDICISDKNQLQVS